MKITTLAEGAPAKLQPPAFRRLAGPGERSS